MEIMNQITAIGPPKQHRQTIVEILAFLNLMGLKKLYRNSLKNIRCQCHVFIEELGRDGVSSKHYRNQIINLVVTKETQLTIK